MSDYRLDFTSALGSLDLAGADGQQDGDSFWFETLAEGFDLGSPEAVKVIRQSMMRDGSDSYISHYGNRLPTFFVAVNSSDLLGLAEGEAALALFTSARGELSFTPPDDTAYPTVYDVLNVELAATVDDLKWLRPGKKQQVYRVTFECEPWARSAVLSTTTATAVSGAATITIPVGGSVATTGSVTISRPSNVLTEVMLYCDPAMLSTGFSPSNSATWAAAPAGRYLVYVYRENVDASATDIITDDVVVVTVTAGGKTQTIRTRAEVAHDWLPVGEVDLGGNRDGTVGTISLDGTLNGTPMTAEVYRLFRMDSDTSLIYATADAADSVNEIIVDTPSIDFPQGGVWFDGADGLDRVDAWDFPVLVPPQTALWVSLNGAFDAAVTVTCYDRWHTFAASGAS